MSNEATVQSNLNIRKSTSAGVIVLEYRSNPTMFRADVAGTNGPTPGAVTVDVGPGTDISLDQLTSLGGLCWLQNMDDGNYVEYGIYDTSTTEFYPLGELLPGETALLRLSRNLQKEYVGTGTGASGARLRFKANTAACVVRVDAFDP